VASVAAEPTVSVSPQPVLDNTSIINAANRIMTSPLIDPYSSPGKAQPQSKTTPGAHYGSSIAREP
jgi:hypothetical protein